MAGLAREIAALAQVGAKWPIAYLAAEILGLTTLNLIPYNPYDAGMAQGAASSMRQNKESEIKDVALRKVFLTRLANHPPFDRAGYDKFAAQFEDLMPTHSPGVTVLEDDIGVPMWIVPRGYGLGSLWESSKAVLSPGEFTPANVLYANKVLFLETARILIRGAWDMSSREAREVVVLRLIGIYLGGETVSDHYPKVEGETSWDAESINKALADEFLGALRLALRLTDKMHRCQNPKCVVPFFLAERKWNQVYCTPECARVAQRKAKKNWWLKYGTEWRRKRHTEVRRRRKGGK